MSAYDVIIVGAGPAGGECARQLSAKGRHVLLIERAKTFQENNYSSGAGPLEMMKEFDLPNSIVGNYWNKLVICSTHNEKFWQSSTGQFGPVIDFDKLRHFLANETIKHGGQFHLAHQYLSHQTVGDKVEVQIKDLHTETTHLLTTSVLVDATGSERKVLMNKDYHKDQAMAVTGIEYHVEVASHIYAQFANSLYFFLGHKWMPQGYAWIFPMAPNKLKVGVIRYFQNQNIVPHHPSYQIYLQQLLQLCGSDTEYKIFDRHGKTIHYTMGQKDLRYQGSVIAIGDAISSINPLGSEGIRHALTSGKIAAHYINEFLKGEKSSFKRYHQSMNHYFGRKWFFSELIMKHLYSNTNDRLIDRIVDCFGLMDAKQIIDVIFNYRFSRTLKSYFCYFTLRFKDIFLNRKGQIWKKKK